jgi:hypothetical protein
MEVIVLRYFRLPLICATACFSLPAFGQNPIRRPDFIAPPGYTEVNVGPGNTTTVGGTGQDYFRPWLAPGNTNVQIDGPGGADGSGDWLDTRDGDNLDTMVGGAQDTFWGDLGDHVIIMKPPALRGNGNPVLWSGTYKDFLTLQAILNWLMTRGQQYMYISAGNPSSSSFWEATLPAISAELAAIQPQSEPVVFSKYFQLGPYELGNVPPSPLDFLEWLPYDPAVDPIAATADLKMSLSEYHEAVDSVLSMMEFLVSVPWDVGDDGE